MLIRRLIAFTFILLTTTHAFAQTPADYQAVLTALGRTGDFKDGVLKVNIPRGDLKVVIGQRAAPTPFGFGGWVALAKGTGGSDVIMGTAADLAKRLTPALALIPKPSAPPPAAPAPALPALDSAALAKIIGHEGEQTGPVYKITIGRPDINLVDHGARINARMGLNTWAAFTGSDSDAMVAGDVAMLASEVNPVLKALRSNGINVVAIHHHMTGGSPTVYFLHYYGTGGAAKLATGVKAAIGQLGKGGATH